MDTRPTKLNPPRLPKPYELTPNHQRILDLFRDRWFYDREQLTALMAKYMGENGVETALGRLVSRGYLKKNLRNAHHPRAEQALARKRIVFHLDSLGMDAIRMADVDRKRMRRKLSVLGDDQADLTHEVGLSWLFTVVQLGHFRRLWDAAWAHGSGTAFDIGEHRVIPDARIVVNGLVRYVEMENKNRRSMLFQHADRYVAAIREGVIDGRVLWLTRSSDKLRAVRAHLQDHFKDEDLGHFFVFLSQDMIPIDQPELLLENTLLTMQDHKAPLVPRQKSAEQVA